MSEKKSETTEKRQRALQLRKAGATYDQVAQQVGYANRGTAYRAVQTALEELPGETVSETMLLDEQRLEQLVMALWPKAMKGEGWAAERIIKVIELRLKLQEQRRTAVPVENTEGPLQRLRLRAVK